MYRHLASIPLFRQPVINGDKSNYPTISEFVRYHLVIHTVSRETLPMQDSVCCDYFRTSVIFETTSYSFTGADYTAPIR